MSTAYSYFTILPGDNSGKLPSTNLEIIQLLIKKSIDKVISESKINSSDSIELRVSKLLDDAWITKQSVINQLKFAGINSIYSSDSLTTPRFNFDVENTDYKVRYDSVYTEGFLGKKKIKRTISTEMAIQTKDKFGKILFNDILKNKFSDVISVNDISTLELPITKSTHGELPEESFLSHIVEPFIIIGATGIAVYLFFHLRTQ